MRHWKTLQYRVNYGNSMKKAAQNAAFKKEIKKTVFTRQVLVSTVH